MNINDLTHEGRRAVLEMTDDQRTTWLQANRMLEFSGLYTNAEMAQMVADLGAVFVDNE